MTKFVDIILPLPLPKRAYTYSVPAAIEHLVHTGIRVEVQFGKSKLYGGLIERIHFDPPEYPVKPVIAVLDSVQIVTAEQLALWDWIAEYYCCSLGEVMAAALPPHLKLTSETKLVFNPDFGDDFSNLNDEEYLIAEALHLQGEISVDDARQILNKKTVFPVLQSLINQKVLSFREDLSEKFKPKKISAVRLSPLYANHPEALKNLLSEASGKERRLEVLMAYLSLEKQKKFVRKQELLAKADVGESTLKTLVKKGVLEIYDQEISRLTGADAIDAASETLSSRQEEALEKINRHFQEKDVVLLHGVTGSGKTKIYVECIKKAIAEGGQALYLLPEIALTTQIIQRLRKVFGPEVQVYHSKINTNERVEVWKAAAAGKSVILAARSGLFLPFKNLKMVVVDEEHDTSFKQYDPAPRYHARDTAIYLAKCYGAKVLLGTATPSLESIHNAQTEKYGYVELTERYGEAELPEIRTLDLKHLHQTKRMQGVFSPELLEALSECIKVGEQAILFQNRRGYAPVLECQVCGWTSKCIYCDVSLTYHKHIHRLRCHYCNYTQNSATVCPACGSGKIGLTGYGTEKIEEELSLVLPNARVSRLDLDTAGSKGNLLAILTDFEEKNVDILVGTQMVAKGLDFENVAVVGVVGADQLTRFPDFRSSERAFQLLTQVAGRAGRKKKRGKVWIQAWAPDHPVIQDVLKGDYHSFAEREIKERRLFNYPPFTRLIMVQLRHKDPSILNKAAAEYAKLLREHLGERVLGPVIPNIQRIRGFFVQDIMLKLEKNAKLIPAAKKLLKASAETLYGKTDFSRVQISIDVDPV